MWGVCLLWEESWKVALRGKARSSERAKGGRDEPRASRPVVFEAALTIGDSRGGRRGGGGCTGLNGGTRQLEVKRKAVLAAAEAEMCDELRVQLVVLVASRVKAHGQEQVVAVSERQRYGRGQPVRTRDKSEVDYHHNGSCGEPQAGMRGGVRARVSASSVQWT
jgi:hypothetical protein